MDLKQHRSLLLAMVIGLLGAAFTFALVLATWESALQEHERVFTAQADAVQNQVHGNIKATDEVITSLAILVNSATHVDADQFRLFSEELLRRHPYLLSTSYFPRVSHGERNEFEQFRRETGFLGFSINDRSDGDYHVARPRQVYFPMLFLEPFEPVSVGMIGFDVLADPELLPAVNATIETGKPNAAPPYTLETGEKIYWLFTAIYAGKESLTTVGDRRLAVNGLIALRVNSMKLLSDSMSDRPLSGYLQMIPAGGTEPQNLAMTVLHEKQTGQREVKKFSRIAHIKLGEQRLILRIEKPVFWNQISYFPVIAIFIAGLIATVLLVIATLRAALRTVQLEKRNIEIEHLVAEKTSELMFEKERAQVTLASIGDAVITTDAAGRIEYLNAVAEKITGWRNDEAHGLALADVFQVHPAAANTGESETIVRDSLLVTRERKEIAIDRSIAKIRGRDGSEIGSVVVFHDVSQQRKLAQEMSYQASHDALTGLYNRRAFEDRLGQLLSSAKAEQARHALLYLDLDQFKIVNDACGHSAGDQLLRQLSALLRSEIRQSDALARLGGDEFGVLLQNCPENQAAEIAHNVLRIIDEFRFTWKNRNFSVSASIGLVPFGGDSENITSVMSAADAACYAAKDKGRNQVLVYVADDIELNQRRNQMQWVTRLKQALHEDLFVLYNQPIVPIGPNAVSPVMREVLLRMRGKDGYQVSPGAFLPAAERFGLMTEIDRWVVNSTLHWLAQHAGDPRLAETYCINLSGQSLSDARFLGFVLHAIERSGVDPKRVAFEITETAAMTAIDNVLLAIHALKSKGCRFLLDDFGSGWSSFIYLKKLPVDFLKIDGSLIRDVAEDVLDEAMVRAINDIGHISGIATIAEHAETEAIIKQLKAIGVDYAQGYAISHPEPIDVHLGDDSSEMTKANNVIMLR